ncbi:hypothetical protein BEP19_12725 [Ammoniphilus oxalaticus]|uniref:DUF1146 domain-containing protein n=1 Tax=Ammoniphilus oxalaticus TaxID=66863 RepID=A0A419SH37_9BACL|nr:DUF1146 family protein [Ammoniphilus oxalaticus]RKD23083.1 hypothetical protein BEP19_12725 [Ammoniphilus oxalaticus]
MGLGMGADGLINIFISLVFITLSWWALQTLRFELFTNDYKGAQTRLLQILASIALGHGVARFFMDYLGWSLMLKQLFS